MNNKGFILVDALICVFICISICEICFSIFNCIVNYENGYKSYSERVNDRLVEVYSKIGICEGCIVNESD